MVFQYEWKIQVPWGKLALARWGPLDGERVLVVHGRQDSCSVFTPLLEKMPKEFSFVALDMPGNGLSDPFPRGPKLTRLHFVAAMEQALEHLGWESFIFMGHSMGCEQGLFFNNIYPGRIKRMVLLDAGPTFMRMQVEDPEEFQRLFYDSFYENYQWENFNRKIRSSTVDIRQDLEEEARRESSLSSVVARSLTTRILTAAPELVIRDIYTRETAIQSLRRMRDLTENEAQHLLERNIHLLQEVPESERRMYLSWDNRLKHLAPTNYGNDYYYELFKNVPPTLLVHASDGAKRVDPKWRPGALELIKRLVENVINFHIVYVEGGHDVHYTNPERVAPYVLKFLDKNFEKVFCKL